MNDILKQRLVGALVLIALGVIFWPVIFVEGERGSLERESQVEPMPALRDVVIPAPQPIETVEPVGPAPQLTAEEVEGLSRAPAPVEEPSVAATTPAAVEQAPVTESQSAPPDETRSKPDKVEVTSPVPSLPDDSNTEPAPASPALDEQGIPIAWVLQVASVSSREKADQLTAQLIAQDYKAYHRAIRRDDLVLFRVFIGPVFEREKLTAVKRDIDKQLNVSAIIARYVP